MAIITKMFISSIVTACHILSFELRSKAVPLLQFFFIVCKGVTLTVLFYFCNLFFLCLGKTVLFNCGFSLVIYFFLFSQEIEIQILRGTLYILGRATLSKLFCFRSETVGFTLKDKDLLPLFASYKMITKTIHPSPKTCPKSETNGKYIAGKRVVD